MDNPQPYQPLSQALQSLPSTTGRPHYTTTGHHAYTQLGVTEAHNHAQSQNIRPHPEEEEEEDEEDEDEGVVEEQLHQTEAELRVSRPTSPKGPISDSHAGNPNSTSQLQSMAPILEKRRPGRPRGSKNRKPRASAKNESQFYAAQQGSSATPAIAALPSHPNITPQNQPYYEFQWRMLNLCAEFYGAAEELVKATSPLVIAQSYQLGPGVKVDPLAMLGEAKRVCDTLLANPSHLVTNPPPPVYPVLPTISAYPPVLQPPMAGPSTTGLPPTVTAAPAAPITTSTSTSTPGVPSFVVPLNQPPYPQYQVYGSVPHAQYPTAPYYQYPATYPYYPPSQPMGAPIANTFSSTGATATTSSTITPAGNGTPWSDEESERLRKLVEEGKNRGGQLGKVDWEWVVGEWGTSRSKSQIFRQATALGLKESTRGTKRRREDGQSDVSGVPVTPSFQPSMSTATTLTTGTTSAANIPISSPDPSVSHSTSTTTPGASPALQSQQRPSPSNALSTPSSAPTTSAAAVVTASSQMPWPMPTVAVQSAGSVISTPTPTAGTGPSTSSSLGGHDQRSSYYRPRPANSADTTKVGQHHHQQQQQNQQNQHHQQPHHYFLASNGHGQPHGGITYRQKENGKG